MARHRQAKREPGREPSRSGARRRVRLWVALAVAALGALLVLASALGLWAVATGRLPTLQTWAVRRVMSELLPVPVQVERIEGRLTGELRLVGVSLIDPPEDAPQLRKLVLEIDWLRWWESGVPSLRKLRVEGLSLAARSDASGVRIVGLENLEVDEREEDEATATADEGPSLHLGRVRLRDARFRLDVEDGDVVHHLEGELDARSESLRLPSTFDAPLGDRFELAATFARLPAPGLPSLRGELSLEAAAARLEGQLRIGLPPAGSASSSAPATATEGAGESLARLDFAAELATPGADASLPFALSAAKLEGELVAVDLSHLRGDAELASRLTGELTLRATAPPSSREVRQLALALELRESMLRGHALSRGSASLQLDLRTRQWSVETIELAGELGRVEGSGRGQALEVDELALAIDTLRLAALPPGIAPAEGLEGTLSGRAELHGHWPRLRGSVRAQFEELSVEGSEPMRGELALRALDDGRLRLDELSVAAADDTASRLALQAPVALRLEKDAVHVEALELAGEGGRLRVEGGVGAAAFADLALHFEDFDLRVLDAFLGAQLRAGGRLTGRVSVAGSSAVPDLSAQLRWDRPSFGGAALERAEIEIATGDDRLRVDARFAQGESMPLQLSAALPYPRFLESPVEALRDPRSRVSLSLADFDASVAYSVLQMESAGWPELGGRIDAQVEVASTADAARKVTGELHWSAVRVGVAQADALRMKLRSENEALRATMALDVDGREALWVGAWLPQSELFARPEALLANPETRVELRARALEVEWLLARMPVELARLREVGGELDALVELTGQEPEPELRGEISLSDGRVGAPLLREAIGPVDGRLVISNDLLQLEDFRVGSEDGEVRLSGSLGWSFDGLGDVAFEARFDDYRLDEIPLLDTRLRGDVQLRGPLDALVATGELTFDRANLTLPQRSDPLLKEVRVLGLASDELETSVEEQRQREQSAWSKASADIGLEIPQGSRVRGEGANVEIAGSLRVRKRPADSPRLYGTVSVTRGTYRLRGRDFEVEKGVASFEGQVPPDPDVDLTARHDVRDVTIRAHLDGQLSAYDFSLTSEPVMDDSDILAYLLFGRPAAELDEGEHSRLDVTTAQVMGQILLGEFGDGLAEGLHVDRISVGYDDVNSVPTVEVEKQLTDDILVRYDRSFQLGGGDRVEVEWRFWRGWRMQGEVSNLGTSGMDLIWSHEY